MTEAASPCLPSLHSHPAPRAPKQASSCVWPILGTPPTRSLPWARRKGAEERSARTYPLPKKQTDVPAPVCTSRAPSSLGKGQCCGAALPRAALLPAPAPSFPESSTGTGPGPGTEAWTLPGSCPVHVCSRSLEQGTGHPVWLRT